MTSSSFLSGATVKIRLVYIPVTVLVLVIGYVSRQWSVKGSFVHDYVGDAIWAGMIYFGYRFLLAGSSMKKAVVAALVTTWLIEVSQLVQTEWLHAVRHTWLGGLILGYVFLWSDLVMYSVGIGVVWLLDRWVSGKLKRGQGPGH